MQISNAKKSSIPQNPASAYLEEIVLDELNIKYPKINGEYRCHAKIKKINMKSNEPTECHATELTCKLFANIKANSIDLPEHFHVYIQKTLISGYKQNLKNNAYMLDFFEAKIQFQNMHIYAKSASTDTKTRNVNLYGCKGCYKINSSQFGNSMLYFFTDNKISIKDLVVLGQDLNFKYENFKIFNQEFKNIIFNARKIKINNEKDININKIKGIIGNFNISIEQLEYKNTKFDLYDIIISTIKGEKITLQTNYAFVKNNQIFFPNQIHIQTKDIKLEAENGKQNGNMIMLKKIRYKTSSINGFSETGYFDIKNSKLILENGKIIW